MSDDPLPPFYPFDVQVRRAIEEGLTFNEFRQRMLDGFPTSPTADDEEGER